MVTDLTKPLVARLFLYLNGRKMVIFLGKIVILLRKILILLRKMLLLLEKMGIEPGKMEVLLG